MMLTALETLMRDLRTAGVADGAMASLWKRVTHPEPK